MTQPPTPQPAYTSTVVEFGSRGNAWWGRSLGEQEWRGEGAEQ